MTEILGPGPDESLDLLAGDWRVFQLRKGHRFSTDDLVTAWFGALARPGAARVLDLGAGIGSVGLATLWLLDHEADPTGWRVRPGPRARLWMVEAQEVSHQLARRSVAHNGLVDRVTLRCCDLRDPAAVGAQERFDLVLGSPPYIPVGKGHVSPHPQRAACRIELRGDVLDYCRTAARALAVGGRVALVHAWGDPRPEAALLATGLCLLRKVEVVFRRGRTPTIVVYVAGRAGEEPEAEVLRETLTVREADGTWTEEWRALRAAMGAPEAGRER
ncbi:SAM-dependent methyltransferase [Myxococcota bacterium]|nr:SAM-dependent methyltransferase [Myxococcota bacterium]